MAFLHGVETIELEVGGQTVSVVKTAIVFLLGIAPIGAVNELKLCLNETDDAQFGEQVPGFNIPRSLAIIRAMAGSSSPILVVNTFDSATNLVTVSLEAKTVTNGALKLSASPIGNVSVFAADGTTPAAFVKGTDYTLDEFGNFKVISTAIANATQLKFTFKKLDPATVTTSQLIGAITSGVRTGLKLADIAYNTFGFTPKIFIAPGYSHQAAIATAFETAGNKFRAVYPIDAPAATTPATAIAGRGIGGSIAAFQTSSQRAMLLYPQLKFPDPYTNTDADFPYSAFWAGLVVKIDNDPALGYWYSPSNQPLSAAVGSERVIEWAINDPNCEANQLNAAGITTIAAGYGTGILAWGNRSAAFPTSGSVKNFMAIRRVDDIVIESMERAALPYVAKPLNQALIDTIRESGNNFLRVLIGMGAVLPGSQILYNKSDNPPSQLANGQVVFERNYMVPPPAERITYKDVMNLKLLNQFN